MRSLKRRFSLEKRALIGAGKGRAKNNRQLGIWRSSDLAGRNKPQKRNAGPQPGNGWGKGKEARECLNIFPVPETRYASN